ncbi:MAG: hypothetical protein R3B70_38060 [Polyangiaceae bacterium]
MKKRCSILALLGISLPVLLLSCGGPGAPACGDGVLDPEEQCDGQSIRGELDCRDFGFLRGELGCDPSCGRVLTNGCESSAEGPAVCGNNAVDSGEECDGAAPAGMDCERLDLGIGALGCTGDCLLDKSQCSSNIDSSCEANDHKSCSGGDLYWFDSCNEKGSLAQSCGGCGCNGTVCATCSTCKANDHKACVGGDLYWFDSCNEKGSLAQSCGGCGCNGTVCSTCPECSSGDTACNGFAQLKQCVNGHWSTIDCASACASAGWDQTDGCAPSGQGYYWCSCSNQSCGAASYWSPPSDSDTDGTGTQWNQTISTGVTVEVAESGVGLKARVCKSSGTFANNIAFSIYDAATNSTVGAAVSNLATMGEACSPWVELKNDNGYTEGQQFGGIWQVVSPAGSAGEWGWPYGGCGVSGSPGGTCWTGLNLTLTRSCK